jgi:hypothetical protein
MEPEFHCRGLNKTTHSSPEEEEESCPRFPPPVLLCKTNINIILTPMHWYSVWRIRLRFSNQQLFYIFPVSHVCHILSPSSKQIPGTRSRLTPNFVV